METLTKNQSFQSLKNSDMLAREALKQARENGVISVTCPACHQKLTMSQKKNRTLIHCPCFKVYWEFIGL